MSYATYDFSETLKGASIDPIHVARVIAAWGTGSGMGEDTGKGWSPESVSDWTGGFLLQMKAGEYRYLIGWCDYTGWGCQDGVKEFIYSTEPTLESLSSLSCKETSTTATDWDENPADLNKWLHDGAPDSDE